MYGKAIKKIIPQNTAIINLANKFKNIREYSWAIKTYQQGRILLKKPDAFLKELGDCYLMERDYEQMMPLFVRTLELNPGSIDNITVQLSFARSNDIVNSIDPVIEKTLKSLCQKTIISRFLMNWLYGIIYKSGIISWHFNMLYY